MWNLWNGIYRRCMVELMLHYFIKNARHTVIANLMTRAVDFARWQSRFSHAAFSPIIDLSHACHQPMSNEDSSVWIAYEWRDVYLDAEHFEPLGRRGHKFKSQFPMTEVIVHLAGKKSGAECLHRLRGMFAIALWDERNANYF